MSPTSYRAAPPRDNKNITYIQVIQKVNGGGRGIRTPAGFDTPVGFQDRSLQPDLGIPPYDNIQSLVDLVGLEPTTGRL
jgi:hypothetical protein